MIGFGKMIARGNECGEPDEPHPWRHCGHGPSAVKRNYRQQVEEV